jgi:DNA-binding response OmpR family regulator
MLERPTESACGVSEMVVLDAEDVLQLLRSEIERAGGPTAFSKKARVDRATAHRTLKREVGLSRKIINALDLRVVYAPKQDKQGPNIEIRSAGQEDGTLLFIDGKSVKAMKAQVALVACLYNEQGRVVPYERLYRLIGHRPSKAKQVNLLRQYMMQVRRLLTKHKAGYSIAVDAGVGYALCEVAQG